MKLPAIALLLFLMISACGSPKSSVSADNMKVTQEVNINHLKAANASNQITKVPCTLSDGTETECYQIVTTSTPTDHQMGPWCPTNVADGADAGGIWLKDGKVYDVDGAFVKNMAQLYGDDKWKMYDADGNIFVTETEQDCINAANPNVGEEYQNFCVECLPSYITDVSKTYLIPVKPSYNTEPVAFMGRGGGRPERGGPPDGERPPRGDGPTPNGERPPRDAESGGVPANRGIALNGVEFSAPAPVNVILAAYTLAPFDDAGGHINVHQGYHYHTATGVSYAVEQEDNHAPLIGYAMDGHGIYSNQDDAGNAPTDLDECRGHYDDVRGYHYHVDAAGNNNFINCLHGAFAN